MSNERKQQYADAINQAIWAPVEMRASVAEAVMAVADAEQAQLRAEVDDLSARLSALLCDLTRGRMSKTNYDVRTIQAVEESFDEDAAEAEAKVARVEALADDWAAGRAPTAAAELRAALEGQ